MAVAAALTVAVATPSLGTTLPTPGGKYGAKLSPSLMGMHVHYLSNEPINTSQKFGSVRIWDNSVRWDQINTEPGSDWSLLDRVVANAEATGAKEIVYVLGLHRCGPRSTPPPTSSTTTVQELRRYRPTSRTGAPGCGQSQSATKGRITAYQPWNEANLKAFFYAGAEDSPRRWRI